MTAEPGSAGPVGEARVDTVFVEAIQDGTLHATLADLGEIGDGLSAAARRRLDEATRSIEAVERARDESLERAVSTLRRNDVAIRSTSRERNRPIASASIEIDRNDVDRAVAALESDGYHRDAPSDPAGWRAYRATWGFCRLHRVDSSPFRVELSWPTATRGTIRRLITPHRSDFDAIALPQALWFGYPIVHLVRLPWRRATRREPVDLGPFLATPDALIDPLLRAADVGSDDVLVDLGCGDGRIVIRAAELSGCRARGVESDRRLAAAAARAAAASPAADRIEIVQADASVAPLADADVVFAFLPAATVSEMVGDLLRRLRPGARLIVHEQERVHVVPDPDVRTPLFSDEGITVAHRWDVSARART